MERKKRTVQLIKGKETFAEYTFSVAMFLELIVMITDHCASWTLPYRGRVTHVAFLLFCIKMLMTRYDYKQIFTIAFSVGLGIVSYLTCGDEYVIRAVVFVAAGIGIDLSRNYRIIFWGMLIGTITIVSLALLGICGDIVDIRHYGRGMVEARYCLGFNHANNVHCTIWYLIVMFLLYNKRITVKGCIFVMALNALLYLLTRSRTGLITIGMTMIGLLCMHFYEKRINRFIMALLAFVELLIAVILTMYAAVSLAVRLPIIRYIDKLLTGRLEMVSERAYIQLWKWFPPFRQSPEVDNAFAGITYSYGIVVGIFLVITIIYCIYEKCRDDDKVALLVLLSVICMIFMESTYVFNTSLLCNVLLVLLWKDTDKADDLDMKEKSV